MPSELLAQILAEEAGERVVARFLKQHPEIIFWSFFSVGGHCNYALHEFGLGKSLRADFVLIQSYSGGFRVRFVELEPVEDTLFNKDRTPSRRLRIAQKQLHDWQKYIHDEPASIRFQLAEEISQADLLYDGNGTRQPLSFAGQWLRDPKSIVRFSYHIIIGRRAPTPEQATGLKSSHSHFDEQEIVSYDRLLEVAKQRDSEVEPELRIKRPQMIL